MSKYNKDEFSKELMKLPKEMLVTHILEQTNLRYTIQGLDTNKMIIDMKKNYNLKLQKEAVDKLCAHEPYSGSDRIQWLKNHKEWEKLNQRCSDLSKEYERLDAQ